MSIDLVPHDPRWHDLYRNAAADIRGALGSVALGVHHVGSTAVPGIRAKPVIDILVIVQGYEPESLYRPQLGSVGFSFDHRDETHVFFEGTRDGTGFHVHVVEQDADDARAMILFRDRLRADPQEARQYEKLKMELAGIHRRGDDYAKAKTSYVRRVVRQAESRDEEMLMAQRPFTFITQTSATSMAPPEAVYDTIADLQAHLEWSGERASDETFKLLTLESSEGPAGVGTTFTSTGANFNGIFHDRSVVTEASRPNRFAIETEARLDRKRGRPWEVHFEHRYDVRPDGPGSQIVYTETIDRLNYVPYWLQFWMRSLTRIAIDRGDAKQLQNLSRLAEERSPSG